ncbi:MAG: WG repeat-containing protein, partial [Bacteroidales bacterium]|nr:WG repeat-containing protein [Bacteroidales bacterium]
MERIITKRQMNTKRYILLFVLKFICLTLQGQGFIVKDIVELTSDLTARTNVQLDSNGKECALVRVNIPSIRNVEFSKQLILEQEYLPGEYIFYIPEGTKQIPYTYDNTIKGIIDFDTFNIEVKGKSVYRCTLELPTKAKNGNAGDLVVLSNPENAVILVDGIPKGETPLRIVNIPAGKHTISVPNNFGYSISDTIIDILANQKNTISLHLLESDVHNMNIEYVHYGADTSSSKWSKYKIIERNGKKGIIDLLGNEIVPCIFDDVFPELQNGFFKVTDNKKQGLYEPGKGLIVPPSYQIIYTFASNTHKSQFMCVTKKTESGQKYGYINCEGKEIVPCVYDNASQYEKEGFYIVEANGKHGYLKINNKSIEQFISPMFNYATPFDNGYAMAILQKTQRERVLIILEHTGKGGELNPLYKFPRGILIPNIRKTREIIGNKSNH